MKEEPLDEVEETTPKQEISQEESIAMAANFRLEDANIPLPPPLKTEVSEAVI